MSQSTPLFAALALTACVVGAVPTTVSGQPAATGAAATVGLAVADFVFAADMDRETRQPIGAATVFAADVGQVVCFTRVTGAQSPTQITHVWLHEGKVMAKVVLSVRSGDWRTYSTKRVLPAWRGAWEVQVQDDSGTVLASSAFTIE